MPYRCFALIYIGNIYQKRFQNGFDDDFIIDFFDDFLGERLFLEEKIS